MSMYPPGMGTTTVEYCDARGCTSHELIASLVSPRPRPAIRGTWLCDIHHKLFREDLAQLVTVYADLEQAAYVKTRRTDETGKVSGGGGVNDVMWNPHAAAVLARINWWIDALAKKILDFYPLQPGEAHGLTRAQGHRLRLATITRWYHRWLSSFGLYGAGWADQARDHLEHALRALKAESVVVHPLEGTRCRTLVGQIDFGAGETPLLCGAPMIALLRRPDDARESEIVCSADPTHDRLPASSWMTYAHPA